MKRKTPVGILSEERAAVLMTGTDNFHLYRSEARMRADWKVHGPELMRRWAATHPAGTRPFAFWRFDHPDLYRRQIGGTGMAAYNVEDAPDWTLENHFGRTRGVLADSRAGIPEPEYESEAECLDRAGLLTAAEKALLK